MHRSAGPMRESELHRQLRQDANPYQPSRHREEGPEFHDDLSREIPFNESLAQPQDISAPLATPQHATVFLANLTPDVTAAMVRNFFSDVAKVVDVAIKKKGLAFVELGSPEEAVRATQAKNGLELGRRPVLVTLSDSPFRKAEKPPGQHFIDYEKWYMEPQRSRPAGCKTIFIGNIPETTQDEDIQGLFERCGEIKAIRWLRDKQTGKFKGCGFVDFYSEEAAIRAAKLNGEHFLGKTLRVDFAEFLKDHSYAESRPDRRFRDREREREREREIGGADFHRDKGRDLDGRPRGDHRSSYDYERSESRSGGREYHQYSRRESRDEYSERNDRSERDQHHRDRDHRHEDYDRPSRHERYDRDPRYSDKRDSRQDYETSRSSRRSPSPQRHTSYSPHPAVANPTPVSSYVPPTQPPSQLSTNDLLLALLTQQAAQQATAGQVNGQPDKLQQHIQTLSMMKQLQDAQAFSSLLSSLTQPPQQRPQYNSQTDPAPQPDATAGPPVVDLAFLPSAATRTPGCRHIFISNLSPQIPEAFLKQQLSSCGSIRNFRWVLDRRGVAQSKAIVEFDSEMGPLKAVAQYHGFVFHGLPVRIDYAPNGRHPEAGY